jgi:hypothetical protein
MDGIRSSPHQKEELDEGGRILYVVVTGKTEEWITPRLLEDLSRTPRKAWHSYLRVLCAGIDRGGHQGDGGGRPQGASEPGESSM